jgi:transposase-like protein
MRGTVEYSDAFRRQVIGEVESGKHRSIMAVSRLYGIAGSETVKKWLRRYGREDLLPKRVRIETLKERDELKEAKARIRDLERAVADAHIDYCLEKAYLHVACKRLGTDEESFKKKHGLKLSDTRRNEGA